jgi:hypothetical protein
MNRHSQLGWATLLVLSFIAGAAGADVQDPERTQGLKAPAPMGKYDLVVLKGGGKFISAAVTKQGGSNDLTFINLDIDGRNVVSISVAALKNTGYASANTYGLVLLQPAGAIKTVTIGFPTPLIFKSDLKLSVEVKESGVTQVLANVIHGK